MPNRTATFLSESGLISAFLHPYYVVELKEFDTYITHPSCYDRFCTRFHSLLQSMGNNHNKAFEGVKFEKTCKESRDAHYSTTKCDV